MPFKVKEHFRKTKKGLVTVKESSRKDRAKKALVIGASALTTLGLGALALRRLNPKTALKSVAKLSGKADDVAANKAKDITALVTPKKYQTLADPWLSAPTTVTKSKKALTTAKKETKLLTGSKYQPEDIADPWNSSIKPKPKLKNKNKKSEQLLLPEGKYKADEIPDPWLTPIKSSKVKLNRKQSKVTNKAEVKEQVLLLKPSSYNPPEYVAPTVPSKLGRRDKDLAAEIRSQRALVKREATDIEYANKRLELANKYKNSDSPSLQQTGANYERAAKEKLTVISKRSPSKKQTGLITTRGNASKSSVRHPEAKLKPEPPLSQTTRIPNKQNNSTDLVTSRRTVLRGLMFGAKQTIKDAPKAVADKAKRSLMDTIGDAKWIDDNIQEIGKKGKNVYKRSLVLSKAKNKIINKAGYELNKNKEGLDQLVDIATLPGKAKRTNRTIKRQSAVIVKQAKKARAALGDPARYHELTTGERLSAGARLIRLLGG